ncbi:MAG: hypothetical protein CM15mP22_6840 [Gammaproteobacteria bacterium]|nr:MAG: hypothetical protein CM15mP22_6840 [Gammaproteobacteria bacterium]
MWTAIKNFGQNPVTKKFFEVLDYVINLQKDSSKKCNLLFKQTKYYFIFMLSTPLIWSGDKYNARVEENFFMPQQICLEGENCGQNPEMATPMTTTTQQIVASEKIKLSEGFEHEIKINMGRAVHGFLTGFLRFQLEIQSILKQLMLLTIRFRWRE